MAYTQELKASSTLLAAKFVAASAAQPKVPERTRITTANVFGLPGSATESEKLRIAKTKHDQAQAKKQGEAIRKEANKKKKRLEVAAGVT